jgi:AcrR family transcriptional regulator
MNEDQKEPPPQERVVRGRERATAAVLDAAYELFATYGYDAVTVRAIAARAGVSHALVHRYLGSKRDIYRAVLTHNEGVILAAAPDDPDLLETASRMLRRGLAEGRTQGRLVVQSALRGVPFDRTSGRFVATERLVELAERATASASAAERADNDLDPRLVVACVVALYLGWGAAASWVLPAAGLKDMDEAEAIDGLDRVIRGILKSHVPGLGDGGLASR